MSTAPVKRDPQTAIDAALRSMHARNAAAPIELPVGGVFPPATGRRAPTAIVGDTGALVQDVGSAVRKGRTALCNLANQQVVRIFCAQHVVDEVERHKSEWLRDSSVTPEAFLRRWHDEYLPLVRVVPDDGIPSTWLTRAERARVEGLARTGSHDIPSIRLAIALGAAYVSQDGAAQRAVYGDPLPYDYMQWLGRLLAGGDAAELALLLDGTGMVGALSVQGAVHLGRRAYDVAGPVVLIAAAAGVILLVKWLRQPEREGLRNNLGAVATALVEVAEQQRTRERHFTAVKAPAPALPQLAQDAGHGSLLGRMAVRQLAVERAGTMCAQEMADALAPHVSCTAASVREIMRAHACFIEVERGRWQLGVDSRRRRPIPDP